MTDSFESILDESISALQAGVSIEEILAEVPEYRAQLRPLLYAASVLADPNPELVPEESKQTLRAEYMRQVQELPAIERPSLPHRAEAVLRIIRRRLTREALLNDLVTVVVTVILTLLMLALLHFLSLEAIPGDFLYGAKRASESVRLVLTPGQQNRLELREQFNQRRLEEVEQLIDENRAAVVRFRGVVETQGENLWVVEGLPVFIPDDVRLQADVIEGDRIEVVGLLRTNNVLVADTIRSVN